MLRATEQEQKNAAGVHQVAANFDLTGWAAVENTHHDLGVDLILGVRDHRLFEPGLMVIAQVKSGSSSGVTARWLPTPARSKAFSRPETSSDGSLVGWWFYESDTHHFDAWLSHRLPAIVVLHDLDDARSYWAHVEPSAVRWTRRGAKILVTRDQTVDRQHLGALLKMASSKIDPYRWEGSAWRGVPDLPPGDRLRTALVAPRLIAPHPNRGMPELDGVAAVALAVRNRFHELRMASEQNPDVPALNDVDQSHEWEWHLAAAIEKLVTLGTREGLADLTSAANTPERVAAATVVHASSLMEDGLADEALAVLDQTLSRDDLGPIDHGWLHLHTARAQHEIGRDGDARVSAGEALRPKVVRPDDVVAGAIAGAAANLAFAMDDWSTRDLESAIVGADHPVAWWRQQETSWGLSALHSQRFKAWARDRAVTMRVDDPVWRPLRTASLIAGFTGDHTMWRACYADLAEYALTASDRDSDPDAIRDALQTLICAGEPSSVELAMRRVVRDGPAVAASAVVNSLDPDKSTRTTAAAYIRAVTAAASLLSVERADAWICWTLRVLADVGGDEWTERVRPQFSVPDRLLRLLAALTDAMSLERATTIVSFWLDQPPIEDQLVATGWSEVVKAIPSEAWSEELLDRTLGRVGVDGYPLDYAARSLAARVDSAVRDDLLTDIRGGSLEALAAWRDAATLPPDVIEDLLDALQPQVEQAVEDAKKGTSHFGGHSAVEAMAVLAVVHPDHARWSPVLDTLASRRADPGGSAQILRRAAGWIGQVDSAVVERLCEVARSVLARAAPHPMFGEPDPRSPAREFLCAARSLPDPDGLGQSMLIAQLAAGSVDERIAAARGARTGDPAELVSMVVALTADEDPGVRGAASRTAGLYAADGVPAGLIAVERARADPGVWPALTAVAGLVDGGFEATTEQAASWRAHADARVRALGAQLSIGPVDD